MVKIVSNVDFGWGIGAIMERQMAKWTVSHPVAWTMLRTGWWFGKRPFLTLGIALAVWLMIRGLWPPLALAVGALLPLGWGSRWVLRLAGGPGRAHLNTPPSGQAWLRRIILAHRRGGTLRRLWAVAATNAGISGKSADGRVPELRNARVTETGIAADIACGAVGVTADKVAKGADVIAASIPGCRQVTVTQGSTPGWAHLHFMWGDPLGATVPLSALPVPKRGRLAFGITQDGEPATVDQQLSLLITGITGSGKSTIAWALIASLLAQGIPFRLWVIDPSGGVELHALKNSPLVRTYAARTGTPGNGNGRNGKPTRPQPGTADAVISDFHAAMHERLRRMSGRTRLHKLTVEEPLEILVIDELLSLTPTLNKTIQWKLHEVQQMGRKAAFSVWALAQLTQKEEIGGTRDRFPQRLCLATPNRPTTNAILGDEAEASGAECSKIRIPSEAGIGYGAIPGTRGYTRFRGVWVPDRSVAVLARGHLPSDVPLREDAKPGELLPGHQVLVGDVVGPSELPAPAAGSDETHVVYAWYAPNRHVPEFPYWEPKQIIYIGRSNGVSRRVAQHAKDKKWSHVVGISMRVLDRFDDQESAEATEERMIKHHKPPENYIHNPEHRDRFPAIEMGPGPSSADG